MQLFCSVITKSFHAPEIGFENTKIHAIIVLSVLSFPLILVWSKDLFLQKVVGRGIYLQLWWFFIWRKRGVKAPTVPLVVSVPSEENVARTRPCDQNVQTARAFSLSFSDRTRHNSLETETAWLSGAGLKKMIPLVGWKSYPDQFAKRSVIPGPILFPVSGIVYRDSRVRRNCTRVTVKHSQLNRVWFVSSRG